MFDKIYLDVPYSEKDEAKVKGARWDNALRKWYFEGENKYYPTFGKWIVPSSRDRVIIAYETIFLLEQKRDVINAVMKLE